VGLSILCVVCSVRVVVTSVSDISTSCFEDIMNKILTEQNNIGVMGIYFTWERK